jgi:hypothetical protein
VEPQLTGKDIGFEDESFWANAPVIYAYTREQAIEDGVLIDVTETARQLFKIPVAVTSALWALIEKPTKYQDTMGRLWDVLWMAHMAAKGLSDNQDTLYYKLSLTDGRKKIQTLKMVCDGGDDGEPVLTIMLSDED